MPLKSLCITVLVNYPSRHVPTDSADEAELDEMIRVADQRLILVSPYLRLSKDIRQLLEYRNNKDKVTTVVFGKVDLKPDEMAFLQSLRFVVLKFNEDLHAKCYINDDKMIITSLNLYQYSIANNKEMGVLIDKNDPADAQLFQDAMNEVDFILNTSQRYEFTAVKSEPAKPLPAKSVATKPPVAEAKPMKVTGYCIRTGVPIPFNIGEPLSAEAYKRWSQYGDPEYPEKFCHFTGESSDGGTCFKRPILNRNWKKAKATHDF